MKPQHALHAGELSLQANRGTPPELTDALPDYIQRDMPQQHADFFAGLSYLPLATMDEEGRPWASLLITRSSTDPSIGIDVSGPNQIDVSAETNPFDPFVRALGDARAMGTHEKRLFAGVGVDFANRRRNKMAGSIGSVDIDPKGKVKMRLNSNQHLGNCPKYITVRSLEHTSREAELVFDSLGELTRPLPEAVKALISTTSTIFLATKHTANRDAGKNDEHDMGLNHRGGAPGFVRLYEEQDGDLVTTYLVLPDHSGNRFYQSLGNIETDRQVGLVLPDFTTGDVLYVAGDAVNLRDHEAEAVMPRTPLLTRIKIVDAVFVKGGLNLKLVSEEHYSPYNPPVKYLRRELEEMGRSPDMIDRSDSVNAILVSKTRVSKSISTFTFELTEAIDAPLPGGFGVFDFSEIFDTSYRHMSEGNPQLVNEDYVRTWTLSNSPAFDANANQFCPTQRVSVTVKRKPDGLISNVLHDYADQLIQKQIQIGFKGTGSGFTCIRSGSDGGPPSIPKRMLWLAGGVGVTPFLSMWEAITHVVRQHPNSMSSDIQFVFSGRDDDINVVKHFLSRAQSLPEHLKIHVSVFQSAQAPLAAGQSVTEALAQEFSGAPLLIHHRRVQTSDLLAIEDIAQREIYACGPESLMKWIEDSLDVIGVDNSNLYKETFSF